MSKGTAISKFYSKLGKEIEKAPLKQATPAEWTNYLRNRGVKQEELQNWQKALENMPADFKMSPQEALEQFRVLGDVPINETKLRYYDALSPDEKLAQLRDEAKFFDPIHGSEHALAGAPEHAYEELVLHSPWAQKLSKFDKIHFTQIPGGDQNVGWLRYNTREYNPSELEGMKQRLFHLDELQSKRHQYGSKHGYDPDAIQGKLKSLKDEQSAAEQMLYQMENSPEYQRGTRLFDDAEELRKKIRLGKGDISKQEYAVQELPSLEDFSAPFEKNWPELLARRALIEAAEKDADLFSWATGKMQQQRYQDRAGEATSRFYDKDLPNILNKELKAHGATPEHFIQIADPSKAFDVRELPESLAALISSRNSAPDIGHVADLVDEFENNPSLMRRHFYNMGMSPDRAMDAIEDLRNFSIARRSFIDDPELDMEKILDFGYEFVPNYFNDSLKLRTSQIPAVRLTPEMRKSILEKGFPKYIAPLGAIGASMQQEDELQGYAKGGMVKKGLKSLIHENEFGVYELLKNPARKDLMKFAKEDANNQVRLLLGDNGELLAAKASDPIHHIELDNYLWGDADPIGGAKSGIFRINGNKFESSADDSLGDYLSNIDNFFPKYAKGGMVKKGADQLKELLENLHKSHPERMQRAKAAGFDTDQIWLRGSSSQPKPDEFNFFTQDPSVADLYSTSYHRNTFDNTPNVVPVFVKKDVNSYDFNNHFLQKDAESASRHISKLRPAESYILKNIMDDAPTGGDVYSVDDLDDIIEQTLQDQYVAKMNDAKSIFNNFTPEDLESNKFAAGGLVKGGKEILKNLKSNDARRFLKDVPSGELRVMKSPEGDIYSWDASEATHGSILKQLKEGLAELPDDFDVTEHGWEKDIFAIRKGLPVSLGDVAPYEDDLLPEEAFSQHRARWKEFYPFAKGGFVEAKAGNYEDPTPLDQDSIDDLRAAYLNWLHDATLGSDELSKATIGAMLAKGTHPELFEDIRLDDLIGAAKANQMYERHRLSEEHPLAALSGSLATMPLFMQMGGTSAFGQASTNAGAGAINRYMDEENPLDPLSLGIEAGLPYALKYWEPLLKAATLSLPALAKSDNSLFNLENMAHSSAVK